MTIINVKLFGSPVVIKNNVQLIFPYRKAEALFYYLIIKKQASRDILVNLLWGDVDETTARKNLRNAIYMLRKAFDADVFISPQRSVVAVNPMIEFKVDVYDFTSLEKSTIINLYKGEFLEGFFVKDAAVFEEWMLNQREKYKDIYISKIYKEIHEGQNKRDFRLVEEHCKSLIKIDEFDERAYRALMKSYKLQGKYNQALDVYKRLVQILNKELAISPDKKTVLLYEELLKDKTKQADKKEIGDFFYGRRLEIDKIQQNYNEFVQDKAYKSLVIIGEAGIGKSKLIDRSINSFDRWDTEVFTTYCYQAEEKYLLKPWNGIFAYISNFIIEAGIAIPDILTTIIGNIFPSFAANLNVTIEKPVEQIDLLKYQVAETAICDVLERISTKKKLILVFEDFQWIDDLSLSLLKNVLHCPKNKSIMLMASCRDGYERKIAVFLSEMGRHNIVEKIYLNRFNEEEVIDFAAKLLPNYYLGEEIKRLMYTETEGNPFFLVEFLNNLKEEKSNIMMTAKIHDILQSRFINISEEAKKILNIASVFFDKVSFENLLDICGKSEQELMDLIEELQQRSILKEVISSKQNVYLVFTHQKLREFIYQQMSISRRKILHDRIGKLIEKKLTNDKRDFLLYSKLIYHFTQANNKLCTLRYSIKNVDAYLQLHNEVFPVLKDGNFQEEKHLYITTEEALKWLTEIHQMLKDMKQEIVQTEELVRLEATFYHMLGRYYICNGDYEKGLDYIHYVIARGLEVNEYSLVIQGYKQLIYYCINTQNTNLMREYVDRAMEIAIKFNQPEEIAIILRLEGLMKIMDGCCKEGEETLKHSIEVFEALKEKDNYVLNIAAAYNYIGDSKRLNKNFEEASHYYKKALQLCENKKELRGLTIFYRNAGLAAFEMKDLINAKGYFDTALTLYQQLDVLWGKSTVHGYLALLLIVENNYEGALRHLKEAEACARKIKSPYEIGLVYRVKAEICFKMKKNNSLKILFKPMITEDLHTYCEEGIKALNSLKGSYDIELLNQFISNEKS